MSENNTVIKSIKFVILLLSFLFLALILLPIFLFFWIWKSIVKILVWIFKKDYTGIVPLIDIYAILRAEDPCKKPSTRCINALLTAEGSIDIGILRSKIMNSIIMLKDKKGNFPYMRLRQIPVYWCGYPFYSWVDSFKIEDYVKVIDGLDDQNIDDFLRARMDTSFTTGNSYWEIIVGKNYNSEFKSVVYIRFHHCLGDGFSLLKILQTELFQSDDDLIMVSSRNSQQVSSVLTNHEPFFHKIYNNSIGLVSKFYEEYKSIQVLPKEIGKNTTESIGNTCYISTSKPFLMKDLKELKTRKGIPLSALVNAAIFAAFADFIKKEYPKESLGMDYLSALIGIPIPGRPDKFCNHFGAAIVNFPFSNIKRSFLDTACFYSKRFKEFPAFSIVLNLLWGIGYVLPVKLFDKLVLTESLSISLSNIPGSKSLVHFMNCPVLNMKCWLSAYTNPWITFSSLSYNGQLRVVSTGWSRILKSQKNLDELTKKIESELDYLISSN